MQDSTSNTGTGSTPMNEIEFNIQDIIQFFRSNIRCIALWGIGFGIAGAVYAFTAQNEFESKVVVLPEIASAGALERTERVGTLANLASINISPMNSTEAIRPDLYPSITQSLSFALYLLQQKIYISNLGKTLALQSYFESQDENWLSNLLDISNQEKPESDSNKFSQSVEISKKQESWVIQIQQRIETSFDRKTGIITIKAKMPDPVVAVTVARLSVEYIKNYVTNYRTDKARKQLVFLQKQVAEAKSRYQNSEAVLASYRDRNSFLVMNTAKVSEQRLQSEFMLAQNVYNVLVLQYEQAKIRVEEETPIFKMLESIKIPVKKSGPNRVLLILIFTVTGILLSTVFIFLKQFIVKS